MVVLCALELGVHRLVADARCWADAGCLRRLLLRLRADGEMCGLVARGTLRCALTRDACLMVADETARGLLAHGILHC